MTKGKNKNQSEAVELRRRAEDRLNTETSELPQARTREETHRLVHELEVHQIELEMQNAALSQSRNEVESTLEKYTDLYDFSPAGYFTIDRDGAIRALNLTGSRFLGVERTRLIGQSFASFVADESRPLFSDFLVNLFENHDYVSCELTLTKKDASSIIVQLAGGASVAGQERRIAVIDITKRKKAEEALFVSEKIYRAIGESIDYGIWICTPDGGNIYASESFLKLVGLTQEQCSRFGWADVLHPDDAERTIAAWKECVRTGCSWDMEHRYRGVDGQWHDILARGLPVRNERGEILCWSGINLDISRIKRVEEKLKNAFDLCDFQVNERTAELTKANEQLTLEIVERKKAEKSLRASYEEIQQLKERLQAENVYLQHEIAQVHNFGEIIGRSAALSSVFVRIKQVASMNATVLLLGETGTGKGVVARAIHSNSTRKSRPMITVNCSSLPANLIESELFGRERGAFTGATERQIGRFELADGGTIFLDEIGEMPLELQSKLLRVIQDGEFERLGSPRTIKVDVRIIAASNRDLEEEIRNNRFREDLFYRLNVFPITIPPLRQRKEDIPLLVNHFVAKFNKKNSKKIDGMSNTTLKLLQDYHWPGNVRELESVIERAVIISQGNTLQISDWITTQRKPEQLTGNDIMALDELEHDHILQVLQKTHWRIEGKKGAALLLGLNPSTLRARMRKYGIVRE